jgi:O-antigen/teichoic acid export membrane protein
LKEAVIAEAAITPRLEDARKLSPPVRLIALRSNIAWTLAGNVIYAASQWSIFLLLARWGSPEIVGAFALGFAVTSPVILFSQLQLRPLQSTDASHREYRPGDYFALRLVTTLAALFVIAALVIAMGWKRETAFVVLLAGVAKACESGSEVLYGHLQQYEKMAPIARSMIIRGVLSVVAVGVTIRVTGSAVSAAAALAGTWALLLTFHDIPSVFAVGEVSKRLCWDWPVLQRLAVRALPLGVATMLSALDVNIPRYVIAHDIGERALGLFVPIASLQAAVTVIVNALGQSSAPRLAGYHYHSNFKTLHALLIRLIAAALLPGLVLIGIAAVWGDRVPALLFGPQYAHERNVFVWLSIAVAIWSVTSMLGYTATATRRIRFQPFAFTVVATTTLVVCMVAIPRYGILGGAIASAASAAMACALFAAGLLRKSEGTDSWSRA